MSFIIHNINFESLKEESDLLTSKELLNSTSNIKFSLIIGPNGTGKSFFLSRLIDVFRDIESKKTNSKLRSELKFYKIIYSYKNKTFNIQKNGASYSSNYPFEDIELPDTLMALSFLTDDKFIYQNQTDNDKSFYKYLGIRSNSNAVFRGAIDKKIYSILFDNLNDPTFCQKVSKTLELIGYKSNMLVRFDYKLKRLLTQTITTRTINSKIKKLQDSSRFKNHILEEINDEDKKEIINYIKKVKKLRKKDSTSSTFVKFDIDFNDSKDIYNDYRISRMMVALELLLPPTFELSHINSNMNFESLSSGEKNLLFITLNILANAKNNSLILIDEPEVSLHPNWQIKYNVHLKKILKDFKNIHIFMATHSHFMVSGLERTEADIFAINKDKSMQRFEEETYTWSAENILYNIFGVRTVGNYYMKSDISNMLKLVSKNESIEEIAEIYKRLEKLTYHKNDPLVDILQTVNKHIINFKGTK
jgi:predicted ATPase